MSVKLAPSERLNLLNKYRVLASANSNMLTHVVFRSARPPDVETAEPAEAAEKLRAGSLKA